MSSEAALRGVCTRRETFGTADVIKMNLIRWSFVAIFLLSVATLALVHNTGYTGVATEGSKYFVTFKSTRYEVSQNEYEQIRRRDRISNFAAATMVLSLFAFIGLEWLRLGGSRQINLRRSGPKSAERILRVPVGPKRHDD